MVGSDLDDFLELLLVCSDHNYQAFFLIEGGQETRWIFFACIEIILTVDSSYSSSLLENVA